MTIMFGGVERRGIPESDAELARCIFDSLALLYADVLHELASSFNGRSLPSGPCVP